MTVVGVFVFLAGWIYAIANFGFFLGVGLGWIPALFIAWILDFLVIAIFGLSLVIFARKKGV